MPPDGASEGVDRLKMAVCCRDGCHLVAGFVAGDFPVWIREKPVNKAFSNIYLSLRQRKQRDFFQENSQSKIYRPDGSLQVSEVRCRTSLPVLPSGLLLYGGSLW